MDESLPKPPLIPEPAKSEYMIYISKYLNRGYEDPLITSFPATISYWSMIQPDHMRSPGRGDRGE
jgi:hypothetical protein